MKPSQTPNFQFSREGKRVTCWFTPHPLKDNEGKVRHIGFSLDCESELEATLLTDYVDQFNFLIRKEYFTEGYNAKKRKDQNYYL